jgi:cytosine/adenosine deaminase-related metal-dependent hydrolase
MATYRDARSMEEYTDRMNIEAAILLGEEDKLGALDLGNYGDFAVFDGDPFQGKANVVMTILGGQVVYDQEEDKTSDWYKDYQKTHLGEDDLGDFEDMEDYEDEE